MAEVYQFYMQNQYFPKQSLGPEGALHQNTFFPYANLEKLEKSAKTAESREKTHLGFKRLLE